MSLKPLRLVVLAALAGAGALVGPGAAAQTPADSTLQQAPTPPATTPRADSTRRAAQPVRFAAQDSLVVRFGPDSTATSRDSTGAARDASGSTTARSASLFGQARVNTDSITITAGRIDLDFRTDIARARPLAADSGATDRPRFERGEQTFDAAEFTFNLATGRGRVVEARAEVDDGFLLADVVKQTEPTITFARQASYTTCDNPLHRHYELRAGEMKVVEGEEVYSGPIRLYILGVPTPLWLPFGFIPTAEGRRSGPLPPSYGEDRQLGFYLRNLGWYFALNDYMDLQLTGGVYTSGSLEGGGLFRYNRRYRYSGSLGVNLALNRRGESTDLDFARQYQAQVRWQHRQDIGATASLSAGVNLASRGYLREVSQDFDEIVSQTTSSSIDFNKRWSGGARSLSLSLRGLQQLDTGGADFTLPSVRFAQQPLYPFRSGATGSGFLDNVQVSYTGQLDTRFRFTPLPDDSLAARGVTDVSFLDALFSYDDFVRATGDSTRFATTARHSVPLSAPISINQLPGGAPFRLTVTPSLTYSEDWYSERQRQSLDADGGLETTEDRQFTAIRRVSAAVGASTEFFGLFPLRLKLPLVPLLDGLRHTVRPTASFTFEPAYDAAPFNYFRPLLDASGAPVLDSDGEARQFAIAPGVPQGGRRAVSFGVGNVFQTRLVEPDTTGEEQRRTIQLLSVDVRSAYDFARDSLRLGDVSLSARSQFGQFRFQLTSQFSPYARTADGRILRQFYLQDTGRPLRLSNYTLSADATFRSSRGRTTTGLRQSAGPPRAQPIVTDPLDVDLEDPFAPVYYAGEYGYVDYEVPWSLSLGLQLGARFNGATTTRTATLEVRNVDLSLTQNWKIQGRTGFDFAQGEITTTQLAITRDLHCWEMRLGWVPFGRARSFSFSIYVKSGRLRDLLRLDSGSSFRDRFTSAF